MKNKKLIIAVYMTVAILIVATAGLGITVSALSSKPEGVICEGISVNGIAMGGKTGEEAEKVLSDYITQVKEKELIVDIIENGEVKGTETASFESLGVKAKSKEIINEIVSIGDKGNIIDRYKAIKSAKENKPEYHLDFKYDKKKLEQFVNGIVQKYDVAPENAGLKRVDGKFIVSGGKTGKSINSKISLSLARESFDRYIGSFSENSDTDVKLEFLMVSKKPKYDKEALLKVTDLLGTYTTKYTPVGGRGQNVANGCKLIDGSILLPGETLSANNKMAPYTYQNGYGMGTAYVNGKVVPDVGGGICQVSSTLYNAVLFSELEVVQRQHHSLSVDYVELARDAAIAGTWKDFVFKNTSKYPVYVEGITDKGYITFNVYGHETRDMEHRKVELSSVILSRNNGSKAELYKLVYENGVLKEKILLNTSIYRPHEHETAAAKKKAEEEKKKKEEEEKKKKEEEKKKKAEKKKKKAETDDEDDIYDDETDEEGIEG